MTHIRTIVDGGINWTWYLQGAFDADSKTVEVYFYNRWHNDRDPKHPKAEFGVGFSKRETDDGKRILTTVTLNGTDYRVTNPRSVFDYHNFLHLDLEQ
jgi:hypothetical protein